MVVLVELDCGCCGCCGWVACGAGQKVAVVVVVVCSVFVLLAGYCCFQCFCCCQLQLLALVLALVLVFVFFLAPFFLFLKYLILFLDSCPSCSVLRLVLILLCGCSIGMNGE